MEKDNWFNLGVAIGLIAVCILSTVLWIARSLADVERPILFFVFVIASPFAAFIVKCFLGIAKES